MASLQKPPFETFILKSARARESSLYILVSFVNVISSFSVLLLCILRRYMKGQCHFLSHSALSSLSFLTKVFNGDGQGFLQGYRERV